MNDGRSPDLDLWPQSMASMEEMHLHELHHSRNLLVLFAGCLSVTFLPASLISAENDVLVPAVNVAAEDGKSHYVVRTEDAVFNGDAQVTPVACEICGSDNAPYCQYRKDRWADLWDGKMEIGLNGSEGNSRNVNLVFGFDLKYEAGLDTLTLDVDYLFSRDETETTKNRFYSLQRWVGEIPNTDVCTFKDIGA